MSKSLGVTARRRGEGRDASADALVVGLGNPGLEFRGTRHNIGAEVVEELACRCQMRLRANRRLRSSFGEGHLGSARVALAVPLTYMNESGQAVRALVRRFGIEDLRRLVLVHDELDLPPGRVRLKLGGGTAGHNGLESVQAHLHDRDFARVRVGIGKPPGTMTGASFVLRRPSRSERALLDGAVREAVAAVKAIVADGVEPAMNRYNTRREGD